MAGFRWHPVAPIAAIATIVAESSCKTAWVKGHEKMSRSSKANRYGTLAEYRAAERYGLTLERDAWHDARTADGTPVEIKSAMLNRASGKTGRFRLFEDSHRRLRREGGVYVFVAYRARGRGIAVDAMRSVDAREIRVRWYGAGGHRNQRQVKVPVAEVLDA